MGQNKGPYPVFVFFQVGDIGNDQVDAELLFVGKGNAAIEDQDIIPVFENRDIFSNLPDPTQGDQGKNIFTQ
jgi:hypothetical protein